LLAGPRRAFINPFDQPDVEAAKVKTRDLTEAYEKAGALPEARAFFQSDGAALGNGDQPEGRFGARGQSCLRPCTRCTAARPTRSSAVSRRVLRRVGGYNIDSIYEAGHNMAWLLVGSEGTLAFFNEIELKLQPIPAHRVLGICHFPTFYSAMAATRRI
jgi:hypothetical protein